MTDNTKLQDVLPLRTAGALPSSRTEDMLADALASDNIDAVKAQLTHVWAHYQSLEFALNLAAQPAGIKAIQDATREEGLEDADPVAVTARAIATVILEGAYETAHQIGLFLSLGMSAPDALRTLYADLDFSDPEREVSDAEVQAFFEAAGE